MTIIYDVLLIRHAKREPPVCVFYDEEKDKAIEAMRKYVDSNGFTLKTAEGKYTVADVVLRERESTGKEISRKSYWELFDTVTGKIKSGRIVERMVDND